MNYFFEGTEERITKRLLPCPFCGNIPEVRCIGNNATKSRRIELYCRGCRINRRDGVIRQSVEWLESVVVKNWNQRPDPWTYIVEGDAGTLPIPSMKKDFLLISVAYNVGTDDEYLTTYKALFNGKHFFTYPGKVKLNIDEVYAHRPWPDPAPYSGGGG